MLIRCNEGSLTKLEAEIKVLKGMYNRALLQVWFQKYVPDVCQNPGKYKFNIRKQHRKEGHFIEYLKAACSRIDFELNDESIAYARQLEEKYSNRSMLPGINWTLRCVMAPLIEASLLVDRILYLKASPRIRFAALVPVFNASISPRNMAIVAIKKDYTDIEER